MTTTGLHTIHHADKKNGGRFDSRMIKVTRLSNCEEFFLLPQRLRNKIWNLTLLTSDDNHAHQELLLVVVERT